MSTWQGRIVCDSCGGTVPDGSLMECVQVVGLSPDRKIVALHLCLRSDDKHDRCAERVLGAAALAWYVEERAGHEPPDLYNPAVIPDQAVTAVTPPEAMGDDPVPNGT